MDWVKLSAILFLPARKRLNDESIGDTAGIVIVTPSLSCNHVRAYAFAALCWGCFPDIRTSFAALSRLLTVCLLDVIVIIKAATEALSNRLEQRTVVD